MSDLSDDSEDDDARGTGPKKDEAAGDNHDEVSSTHDQGSESEKINDDNQLGGDWLSVEGQTQVENGAEG